jgi:RNA polymerase sigma-70 factor, ECF subfamily
MEDTNKWENEKDEMVLKVATQKPWLFKILIQRYQEAFIRKAMTVVHQREISEDIVQETFVKIYRYAGTFQKREGIEFKSWAYKILMNTSFTHYAKLQKEKGNVEFMDYLDAGEMHPHDNFLGHHEMTDSVKVALGKMPEPLAKVLEAYYFQDKSYKDIAEEQHITLPALKMRLFRAKKIFRKHFELGESSII